MSVSGWVRKAGGKWCTHILVECLDGVIDQLPTHGNRSFFWEGSYLYPVGEVVSNGYQSISRAVG